MMTTGNAPYDQRLARMLIRPFAGSALHPNHVTTLSLLFGMVSGCMFLFGSAGVEHLGAALFIAAVLTDHMDGELARMTGKTSTFGHYFDYIAGSLIYTILFCSLGVAMFRWFGSEPALWIGLAAGSSNILIVGLRIALERRHGSEAVEHPRSGGFEIEDFIYLIGPITWFGGLVYFFWVYALGTLAYLLWTLAELLRREVRHRRRLRAGDSDF
ncbi:MAG: CDP-alcohol phosphatidyltransferase family protein [Rickettsiales bacterium]|jgi:archaetidylinositol phosphate synthase